MKDFISLNAHGIILEKFSDLDQINNITFDLRDNDFYIRTSIGKDKPSVDNGLNHCGMRRYYYKITRKERK